MTRDLVGRTVVVTGGNAGLGYFTAEQLARRGARLVIASRNEAKANLAIGSLLREVENIERPSFVHLDLADLASVSRAADELADLPSIDVLVANAGITEGTADSKTVDGFESMFGTNHLGHFALISQVMPALLATAGSRIVHLGSISHRFFALDLDDDGSPERFRSFPSYSRSKLAVMTFAFELDRRLREAGHDTLSIVAHPGFALDELTPTRHGVGPSTRPHAVVQAPLRTFAQGKDAGAWPIVLAATDGYLRGGEYIGPAGWQQLRGRPRITSAKAWSRDPAVAARLWRLSEDLTGTSLTL
ncbi:SDR family NAD(P)-dependent oxidoreductase [Agreia pratensis]|uniref:SDR family NAD(P)-dependent oxidoreductase n=1 Tax=Agreia pratensis TaxID=150121 RepID=UPI00188CBEB1|nr:SDR family NAD(P)-dependent oxidoreductase [Agreia pratensis]MBF4634446.1 SDR family NAD(P)-dependent oxidoreductase [Agreia pratensis]